MALAHSRRPQREHNRQVVLDVGELIELGDARGVGELVVGRVESLKLRGEDADP